MIKNFNYFLIILLLLVGGCKEEDPGFTSLIGSWIYTTPDNKIEVTFDIVGGTTEILVIQNQTIKVDGVEGRAELQTDKVTETTIGMIRINANDAILTYPYNIVFNKLKASEDFSTLAVEEAIYTFPWTVSQTLTEIEIVRKR